LKVLFDYLFDHPLDETATIAFIHQETKSLAEKIVLWSIPSHPTLVEHGMERILPTPPPVMGSCVIP
jgi:hypothetical protein